jgi:hypothetical protein
VKQHRLRADQLQLAETFVVEFEEARCARNFALGRRGGTKFGNRNANAYAPTTIEHVQFGLPLQIAFTLLDRGNGAQAHRARLATVRRDPAPRAATEGLGVGRALRHLKHCGNSRP